MTNSGIIVEASKLLKEWGFDVETYKDAATNGRPYDFNPVGVLVHHTASSIKATEQGTLNWIRYGDGVKYKGPMSQFFVARDLTIHIVTFGRANHAGLGGPLGAIPKDGGNKYLIGIEGENDGRKEPYTPEFMNVMRHIQAALLICLGKGTGWCWGHKEYAPGRKIDPLYDMDVERVEVAKIIRARTTPPATPPPRSVIVKVGDTLWGIAKRVGVKLADLISWNKLTGNHIEPGDELILDPPKTVTRVPTPKVEAVKPVTLPVLRLGSTGSLVAQLQSELNRVFRAYSRLSVDGSYGPATERVIKQFQARSGLTVDGIVGPETWRALSKHTIKVR